ncbi:MAG: beta-lactamase family protein [Lachnospiraceae bacterium]|nr:beta-lactamase family protein [Lachnospiraceae bacterium]
MIWEEISFVRLLWDIMNNKTGELGHVTFHPEKPAFNENLPMEQPFPRSTPEAQGIDSEYLARMVEELGNEPGANMHQLMILRNNHVIYEGGFGPYQTGVWHATYSLCKSFTNMAVGLLIDDGRLHLDDHLVNLLDTNWNPLSIIRMKDITVRHLLTMSSGAAFNEVGAISGDNWVRGYFDSNVKFEPGSQFDYNSMNSLMLSAIVGKITGMSMFDFLKERIFTPMGIRQVFWENSPKGITKGGWGLFITQEDAAKLGTLYLQKGKWKGVQLLSEHWVEESTKMQITTNRAQNPYYGYHIWMEQRPGSFSYNGMLGQNVRVYPDLNLVLVTNAGNGEIFAEGGMTSILRKYLAPDYQPENKPLPENPAAYQRLQMVKAQMEGRFHPVVSIRRGGWKNTKRNDLAVRRFYTTDLLKQLDGECFEMGNKGVGLFPLIMQVVHNNYTWGISRLTFHTTKEGLELDFLEGTQQITLPVDLNKVTRTHINMNGEDYMVAISSGFAKNEDNIPVLSLRICFVEEAAERRLKIYFLDHDRLRLNWDEVPGNTMILDAMELVTTGSGNTTGIANLLIDQIPMDIVKRQVVATVGAVVYAKKVAENQESANS